MKTELAVVIGLEGRKAGKQRDKDKVMRTQSNAGQ